MAVDIKWDHFEVTGFSDEELLEYYEQATIEHALLVSSNEPNDLEWGRKVTDLESCKGILQAELLKRLERGNKVGK